MSAPDVLVVGAGITGASAALALAEAGATVEVVDAYGPAAMASGWTLAGVRQSGRDPAELPLAQAAVAQWPALSERLGAETRYRQDGNLRLARDEAELEVIRALVAAQGEAGLHLELLSPQQVRELAPALSDRVAGASFCPTDGHADPVATVGAMIGAAQRLGVTVTEGERVARLEASGGRVTTAVTARRRVAAGAVIVATGFGVNALTGPLGVTVPLRVPLVTVIRSAPIGPVLKPVVGVANADLAIRQQVDGALRFTSGAENWSGEMSEEDGRPTVRPPLGKVAETIRKVAQVLPAAAAAPVSAIWGGLLDLTPDALPVIDRHPEFRNLVIAVGFSGHGFGIGPVTGPLAADLALGREPAHPLAAFRLGRFAEGVGPAAELTLHG